MYSRVIGGLYYNGRSVTETVKACQKIIESIGFFHSSDVRLGEIKGDIRKNIPLTPYPPLVKITFDPNRRGDVPILVEISEDPGGGKPEWVDIAVANFEKRWKRIHISGGYKFS